MSLAEDRDFHSNFNGLDQETGKVMQINDVGAGQEAAGEGNFPIRLGVGEAQIVPEQIEDPGAVIRIAHRHVAGATDPEVDVGRAGVPRNFHTHMVRALDLSDGGGRIEERQHECQDQDEGPAQDEQGVDVAYRRRVLVVDGPVSSLRFRSSHRAPIQPTIEV